MRETTLNEILADFSTVPTDRAKGTADRSPITIWVAPDIKARYDKLQERSGRKFSKKAREALMALIHMAESRAG